MTRRVQLAGRGLHTGAACSVTLTRSSAGVAFVHERGRVPLEELRVVRADLGVRLARPGSSFTVELVEHLFAALGGLGVYAGIELEVDGPEVPLVDGSAQRFAEALLALDAPSAPPALVVERAAQLKVERSSYFFEPADAVRLEVEVQFRELPAERASWDGSRAAFLTDIAPARTFGFLSDAELLRRQGRALHVDPAVVLVLDEAGRALAPAAPVGASELARHKLLDLVGDSYLYGGPPLGRLRATRPGHAATHRVFQEALAGGILRRVARPYAAISGTLRA